MKGNRRVFPLLAALLLIVAGAWFWAGREPAYEGRTLCEWCDLGIGALGNDPRQSPADPAQFLMASNAVWQIGERAVPWLDKWVYRANKPGWEAWLKSLGGGRWDSLDDWMLGRQQERWKAFSRPGFISFILRERTANVIPRLMDHRSGDEGETSRSAARFTARLIGPSGMERLLSFLADPSPERRWLARGILSSWGTDAISAGPLLWSQLASLRDPDEQKDIFCCLSSIGYRPEETAAHLRKMNEETTAQEKFPYTWRLPVALIQTHTAALPHMDVMLTHTNYGIRWSGFIGMLADHDRRDDSWREWFVKHPLRASWPPSRFSQEAFRNLGREAKINCLLLAQEKSNVVLPDTVSGFLRYMAEDPDSVVAKEAREILETKEPSKRLKP
jgi:hypothetical protein